jgi:protein-tyrosine phosphatase
MTSDKLLCNKVSLFLERIGNQKLRNVPDPYYGGEKGFEELYFLLDEACEALLDKLASGASPSR